ncbi:hypothetical protein [Tropicimonas sp. IMCC34011]|uniref:hypothetical protein n=1 Tax=Tropicimonas sp. IMCC34011 TaxID=2248759 RepID=UPI000E2779AF|nr:hypothetical protein [Tropicimonas sp. IMCC34011]
MRIVYHIGLHCTDEDRALRCLLKNSEMLRAHGTVVAVPGRFRPVLREAMVTLRGQPAGADTQESVLDAVTDVDSPERIVFSSDSFLCVPARAVGAERLYPQAGERAPWIRNLFPDDPAEFALSLRNPATLLPALHERMGEDHDFAEYISRIAPEKLSWAEMVERLVAAVPGCPVTVWANEDTPLIWHDVLRALAGHPEDMTLEGETDFLGTIMKPEGVTRMDSYLASHPPKTPDHRRRITAAFLDKFARPGAVEEEFELPGWTQELVGRLTETYEADLARIAGMDGVRVIAP